MEEKEEKMISLADEYYGYLGANDPNIDLWVKVSKVISVFEEVEGPYDTIIKPGRNYVVSFEDKENYYICFGHGEYWPLKRNNCDLLSSMEIENKMYSRITGEEIIINKGKNVII